MVYKGRLSYHQDTKWQKKSNACETKETDSIVELGMPLQAQPCSYREALMKGAAKCEECPAYAQSEDDDDDEALALGEHGKAMDLWSQTDESTKFSWADVSEPSEVRSQAEDSVKLSCADLIDEDCTFEVGDDIPDDSSYDLQDNGFKTPSSLASADDYGNFDMYTDYTASGDGVWPMPLHWEGTCDYAAAHYVCYDNLPSVLLCSGAANASVNTNGKHNSSLSNFHDRVSEALAAAKEHERSIKNEKERGRATSSIVVEEAACPDSGGVLADEAIFYGSDSSASFIPEVNETAMQSDWPQSTGNVQLYIPGYIPVLVSECCDVMTNLLPEHNPQGLDEMSSYRGVLHCTDFPSEFQSAIAASSFKSEVQETGSHAKEEVLADTSSMAQEHNIVEKRVARDGCAYSHTEFCQHYGNARGDEMWDEATRHRDTTEDIDAMQEAVRESDSSETHAQAIDHAKMSGNCCHQADAETMSRGTDESETVFESSRSLTPTSCQDSDESWSYAYTEIAGDMTPINADVSNSSMVEFPKYCTDQLDSVHTQAMVQYYWYPDAQVTTGCMYMAYFACEGALDDNHSWPELECGLNVSPEEAEWLEANLPSSDAKDKCSISHANVPRVVDWNLDSKGSEDIDEPTTFMIHNVPNEYTRTILIDHLDYVGLRGKVDFIYLPVDRETKQNVGYAFINFVDAKAAAVGVPLLESYEMSRMRRGVPKANHQKVWISRAHLQGFRKNVEHYSKTSSKPLVRIDGRWTDILPTRHAEGSGRC